jgi:hypothetical protein
LDVFKIDDGNFKVWSEKNGLISIELDPGHAYVRHAEETLQEFAAALNVKKIRLRNRRGKTIDPSTPHEIAWRMADQMKVDKRVYVRTYKEGELAELESSLQMSYSEAPTTSPPPSSSSYLQHSMSLRSWQKVFSRSKDEIEESNITTSASSSSTSSSGESKSSEHARGRKRERGTFITSPRGKLKSPTGMQFNPPSQIQKEKKKELSVACQVSLVEFQSQIFSSFL